MKLRIEMNLDNAAFQSNGHIEVCRLLAECGHAVMDMLPHDCKIPGGCGVDPRGGGRKTLLDVNGNNVGEMRVTR